MTQNTLVRSVCWSCCSGCFIPEFVFLHPLLSSFRSRTYGRCTRSVAGTSTQLETVSGSNMRISFLSQQVIYTRGKLLKLYLALVPSRNRNCHLKGLDSVTSFRLWCFQTWGDSGGVQADHQRDVLLLMCTCPQGSFQFYLLVHSSFFSKKQMVPKSAFPTDNCLTYGRSDVPPQHPPVDSSSRTVAVQHPFCQCRCETGATAGLVSSLSV